MSESNKSFCTYDLAWDPKNKRIICRVLKTLLKLINFHSSDAQNAEYIYNEMFFNPHPSYGKNDCLIHLNSNDEYVNFVIQNDSSLSNELRAESFWNTLLMFAHFSGHCQVPYGLKKYNQLFFLVSDGTFTFFLKKEMFDLFHALGNGRIDLAENAMTQTYLELYGVDPSPGQIHFFSRSDGYCEASIGENCSIGLLDPKSVHHMNCGWMLKGTGLHTYKQRLIMLSGLSAAFSLARKHAGIVFSI